MSKNAPIAEPYAGRALKTMAQRREEKWPGMRFNIASFYPVGKANVAPQYQMILETKAEEGAECVVLAFGNGEKSTTYCPADEAHLYVGPTSVLMGEPIEPWKARQQADFRHVEKRLQDGPPLTGAGQEATVSKGEVTDAGTYSHKQGDSDELS